MSRQACLIVACTVATLLVGWDASAEPKAATKPAVKDNGIVGGLVIDKHDDSILVTGDGEDEPVKYLIGPGLDKRSLDALKTIFGVDRVQLKYKMDGEARRVVAIEKVPGKATGVVTGEVLKVYNNFWVAVKPKDGPVEGYACSWPAEKAKATTDVLKTLKPGDVVVIRFTSDFERHRIQGIEVKPTPAK